VTRSPLGGKPPLGPTPKCEQSPQPSSVGQSERRPSRIIGRFEVMELFPPESSLDNVSQSKIPDIS
jgi:hypothetical protein